MIITKEHIGKTIYGMPTGDNINRSRKNKHLEQLPVEFVVVSVARRYANLKYSDYHSHMNADYCRRTGVAKSCVQSGYASNAGYVWHESLSAIEVEQERRNILTKLRSYFGGYHDISMNHADAARVLTLVESAQAQAELDKL